MTSFASIGDLSRSFHLRLANHTMKGRLDVAAKEMTTGIKSDIAKALGGDLSRINQISSRLQMLSTYQRSAREAASVFDGMQNALESIQTITESLGPALISEALSGTNDQVLIRASQGPQDFRRMVNVLNVEVAGRHLFSGTQTDAAPLQDPDDILSAIKGQLTAGMLPSDIVNAVNTWFDAPNGSGGFLDTAYLGDDTGKAQSLIGPNQYVGTRLSAGSPELRDALKGAALLALVADPDLSFDLPAQRNLMNEAGKHIVTGNASLTFQRSTLGSTQAAIAQASMRHSAEETALSLARLDLIGADPYEAASAIQEFEAGIQTLYTLTARLSRLSLTEYLR